MRRVAKVGLGSSDCEESVESDAASCALGACPAGKGMLRLVVLVENSDLDLEWPL